jgi:flagellar biosynthetic protein FliQ
MTPEAIFDIVRQTLWTTMLVAGPALLAALVVGLAVSLLQALTQIQEMTLTLLPKLVAIAATLGVAMPFMWAQLRGFTEGLFALIAGVGAG